MPRTIPILSLLLFAGCGTDLSNRPLGWEEGWDLIVFLGDETFFTVAGGMRDYAGFGDAPPPAEPSGPYQLEIDASLTCSVTGAVQSSGLVEGVYDTAARTVSGSGTLEKTFPACVHGTTRDQYTMGRRSSVAVTHSIALDEQQLRLTADMGLVGTLDWSALRDRSGTCTLDVQVYVTVLGTALQTVRGNFCDHEYDNTVPWMPLYGG